MKGNTKIGKDLEFGISNAYDIVDRTKIPERSILEQKPCNECADCLILKQSLSENKRALTMIEKKTKILTAQKNELQKELLSYKSSYN